MNNNYFRQLFKYFDNYIIIIMKNLFSTDKQNNNRQIELDIAKGLAIIFMIFVHCGMIANFFPNN